MRIKDNRLLLLKALRDHIDTSLDNAEINPNFESDVADMLTDMKEKKNVKRLKVIKKELDKWIKEMETTSQ